MAHLSLDELSGQPAEAKARTQSYARTDNSG
jgi:hypothetical protein